MHSRVLKLCTDCPNLEFYRSILLGAHIKACPEILHDLALARDTYLKTISKRRVYGASTGVGALQSLEISHTEKTELRLILEHAAGVGRYLDEEPSRMVLTVRIVQLSRGYSPVRPQVLEKLIEYLAHGIIPALPVYGSVGASGDLVPLAHMVYTYMGKGKVWYRGRLVDSALALREEGLEPLRLEKGEALSLINGTAFSTGVLIYVVLKLAALLRVWAEIAGISIGLSTCNPEHYQYRVASIKMHRYPNELLGIIEKLVEDYSDTKGCSIIQDPYSLRCTPQIFSAVYSSLEQAALIGLCEACSPTDNPIVMDGGVKHQCSFHGVHIALSADSLAIAMAVLANNAERRISQLLDKNTTRVETNFLGGPESPSGYMIAQYTAASRTALLRQIAAPYSVHNIPTSLLQEDVVSMSANASVRLLEGLNALIDVAAIELVLAARLAYLKGRSLPEQYKLVYDMVSRDDHAIAELIAVSRKIVEDAIINELRAHSLSWLSPRCSKE
ncbi:MAG: aromatic amino acid ammonia-lyase [Pyrodictiaceae archaeon]